jgi:hypothetical protein
MEAPCPPLFAFRRLLASGLAKRAGGHSAFVLTAGNSMGEHTTSRQPGRMPFGSCSSRAPTALRDDELVPVARWHDTGAGAAGSQLIDARTSTGKSTDTTVTCR